MSKTDAAILGMLTIEPMSGYDMKRFCDQSLAHFWHQTYGNLYPRLRGLEDRGLVQGRKEPRDRAPDAIVYTLTEAGRERFASWMEEDPAPEQVRSDFMLKIFFGAQADLDLCAQRIRDYQVQQEAKRDSYAEIEEMLSEAASDRPEAFFWLLSLRRGQLLTEARLAWCAEARELIARRLEAHVTEVVS